MPLWSKHTQEAKSVSTGRRRLTVVISIVAIILSVAAIVWQRWEQTKESAAVTGTESDTKQIYENVTKEQTARTAGRMKPTTTIETGDLGGKFFGQVPDPAKTRHYYIAAE